MTDTTATATEPAATVPTPTPTPTPTAKALLAKRKGNECFVRNELPQAIEHYTTALNLIVKIADFDKLQTSHLFANRAECHIRLKKHGTAIKDCNSALNADATNIKALFRRAKANEALSHYKNALKDLQVVLRKDINNTSALDLMRIVQRKLGIGTGGKKSKSLDYDPETDVTMEDQANICQYNVYNHQKIELEDAIQLLNTELSRNTDAMEAVEMLLDEDACRINIGNCFMFVSNEETEEYLQTDKNKLNVRMNAHKSELRDVVEKMTKLRAKLKAKFGEHIGLPELKPSAVLSR